MADTSSGSLMASSARRSVDHAIHTHLDYFIMPLLSQHLWCNPLLDRAQLLRPRRQPVGQAPYLLPR